jgi:hypothetical protein
MERAVSERVEARLSKLSNSRDTGNGPVNAPKSSKSKYLGRVVTSMGFSIETEKSRNEKLLTRWLNSKEVGRKQR